MIQNTDLDYTVICNLLLSARSLPSLCHLHLWLSFPPSFLPFTPTLSFQPLSSFFTHGLFCDLNVFLLSFLLCVCWGEYIVYMWKPELSVFLNHSLASLFEIVSHWPWSSLISYTGWPGKPPVFAFPSLQIHATMPRHLCGCQRLELGSLCLSSKQLTLLSDLSQSLAISFNHCGQLFCCNF